MLFILLFLYLSPLFLIYILCCFIIPLIKIGKIKKGKGIKIYVCKDVIHSDLLFDSKLVKNLFEPKSKYVKIGWGDRKIFLETKSWNQLEIKDFLFAFFGLNKTVLRVQHLEELPICKTIEIDKDQLEIIINYIKNSHNGKLIEKKENYYQIGDYYESNLKYNCITNCNNWINAGLRVAKISNRIWCPLSYWV